MAMSPRRKQQGDHQKLTENKNMTTTKILSLIELFKTLGSNGLTDEITEKLARDFGIEELAIRHEYAAFIGWNKPKKMTHEITYDSALADKIMDEINTRLVAQGFQPTRIRRFQKSVSDGLGVRYSIYLVDGIPCDVTADFDASF